MLVNILILLELRFLSIIILFLVFDIVIFNVFLLLGCLIYVEWNKILLLYVIEVIIKFVLLFWIFLIFFKSSLFLIIVFFKFDFCLKILVVI